jgi:hypothetical protein
MPTFEYTVDGEEQTTTEHELTPTQILAKAGITTNDHYLVELTGQHGELQKSYQGKPNEIIHMHEHMRFVSVFDGSTPVS